MDEKFFGLEQEKQDRILNAALNEFAQKGFNSASTNQIVKEAGISKGALFHYFNNKKDLYLSLYDHFVQMVIDRMKADINWEEKDIFERHREMSKVKMKLFHQYPAVFHFMSAIFLEDDPEILQELEKRKAAFLANNYKEMIDDIDKSKFRKGVDIEKAKNIITWSMEGFSNSMQAKYRGLGFEHLNIDEIMKEMDDYLDVLKQSFYKK
ncbi:TetR/AcrR family transcriptional regulator [Bacillus sp. AK031]